MSTLTPVAKGLHEDVSNFVHVLHLLLARNSSAVANA